MDYINMLNNKKKIKEMKNKALDMLNKATEKITETTNTAVGTVVDTVKNKSNQIAKVGIFQSVIENIDNKLIAANIENMGAKLNIVEYKIDSEDIISIESIVEEVTSTYEAELKNRLMSADYIEALFAMVSAHYNHEPNINYVKDKRVVTLSIIFPTEDDVQENEPEAVVNNEEEHVCNCETKCEVCGCKEGIDLKTE